jgi:prepilin-type N-terminal cleavage/methylation domain-containing protein
MMPKSNRPRAFTLVELLVVMAIISTLMAMLMPAVQSARETARRCQCQNNLKQMGLALQLYEEAIKRLPPGRNGTDEKAVAWSFYILPFMEETVIYKAHVDSATADDPANTTTMRTPVAIYACPTRRSPAADRNFDNDDQAPLPSMLGVASLGDYAANAGAQYDTGMVTGEPDSAQAFGQYNAANAGPMFSGSRIGLNNASDGLSKTIAIGERHIPPVPPGTLFSMQHYMQDDTAFLSGDQPRTVLAGALGGIASGTLDTGTAKFGSNHLGVTQFVYLDGHVATLSDYIADNAFRALCTIAGGEPVSIDGY